LEGKAAHKKENNSQPMTKCAGSRQKVDRSKQKYK
jgi:hypothetical protein